MTRNPEHSEGTHKRWGKNGPFRVIGDDALFNMMIDKMKDHKLGAQRNGIMSTNTNTAPIHQ